MARILRTVTAMVTLLVGVGVARAAPVSATPVAFVKFVDHYNHGRVKVSVNDVTRRLGYGEVKGPFEVEPDSMHNDGIILSSLRNDGCGIAKIGYYFRTGHRYRVVVWPHGYRCTNASGGSVLGPDAKVVDVT